MYILAKIKYFLQAPLEDIKSFFDNFQEDKQHPISYHGFLNYLTHVTQLHELDALLLYCAEQGNLKAVQSLVSKGISLNMENDYSPLAAASYKGHLPVVLYLSQFIKKESYEYHRAVNWAEQGHQTKILHYLTQNIH